MAAGGIILAGPSRNGLPWYVFPPFIRWQPAYRPMEADLDTDPVLRGRPIVLLSKDGHAFWCSKKAISLSSPLPNTVEGGVIFRDSDGRPTGTLREM